MRYHISRKRILCYYDCVIMSWEPHPGMVASKTSKFTEILNKSQHNFPVDILRDLCYRMVNSNLNYGGLVWGYSCQRLNKFQNKATRVISACKCNAHTGHFVKSLDILTLEDVFDLNALKLYYKYVRYLDVLLLLFQHCYTGLNSWPHDQIKGSSTNRATQYICCR